MMKRANQKHANNSGFQFWQQGSHPIELSSNQMIQQRLLYLHNNPVEAGFVDEPAHHLYSSARDYAGIKGLLPITMIG